MKKLVQVLSCKCGVQYLVRAMLNVDGSPRLPDKHARKAIADCAAAGGSIVTVDMDENPYRLYEGTCTCGFLKGK